MGLHEYRGGAFAFTAGTRTAGSKGQPGPPPSQALPPSVRNDRLVNLITLADLLVREQHIGYSGNYAFAIKAGLGVEMAIGQRLLTAFERRPGLFHAALTGFRPAWRAFSDITRGSTSLGEIVRTHPLAQRALTAFDRRPPTEDAVSS